MSRFTFNSKPFPRELITALSHYYYDVEATLENTGTDKLVTPISGPYNIDISLKENVVAVTVGNGVDMVEITLPVRDWKQRILDRMAYIDSYSDVILNGTTEQIEQYDSARRAHHNESANLLQHACRAEGVELDFELARNLFASLAEVVAPSFRQHGQGSEQGRV